MAGSAAGGDTAARPGDVHREVLAEAQRLLNAGADAPPPRDEQEGVGGGAGSAAALVSGASLRLLLAGVDPDATMSDALVQALQREVEAFVDEAVLAGCDICRLRRSAAVGASDVSLYLSRRRLMHSRGVPPGRHRRPDSQTLRIPMLRRQPE